jgi:YYY domain-containing protein
MSDAEALLRWYASMTAIAFLLAPAVAWLGASLGPVRFALLRPVGLAVGAGLIWWPALALGLPFTRLTIALVLCVVGCVGWILWRRRGFAGLDLLAIVAFDGLWLATFAGYALLRSFNPDIANTEKTMEIALLSAISRSTDVPAPDPWLAGEAINYYYFGYQMFATVVKLSGVPTSIAYNLALATLFASCSTVAAGIGLAVARSAGARRWASLASAALAPVLLVLTANLETAIRLVRDFRGTIDAGWWDGVGWQVSRIIVDTGVHGNPGPRETINEFPAFSFILADLHPHVLTYPLLASVLALAIGVATSRERQGYARFAALGGLVGLLYASNSWDAPVGLLLVLGGVLFSANREWRNAIRPMLAVIAGAALVAIPFVMTFHAPVGVDNPDVPEWLARIPVVGTALNTFGIVNWAPSDWRELLIVHWLWIVAFAGWFLVVAVSDRHTRLLLAQRRDALLITGSVLLALALIWMPALVLIGLPLAAGLWVALTARRASDRLIGGLFAIGFLLILTPEFLYIQDVFADRMNTVFKLYFQAWLVLSAASAAAFARLISSTSVAVRVIAAVGMVVLLVVALPYSALSAWDWNNGFSTRRSIDGAAYIAVASPGDYAVINWVGLHSQPGDTIVEAPGCSYQTLGGVPLSRVSAFSGVPTLLGWHGHEGQWRRGDEELIALLDPRANDANAIISGEQIASSDGIAPRFLILGRQELEENPGCSLSRARDASVLKRLGDLGWVVVFEYEGARVLARSTDPLALGRSNHSESISFGKR